MDSGLVGTTDQSSEGRPPSLSQLVASARIATPSPLIFFGCALAREFGVSLRNSQASNGQQRKLTGYPYYSHFQKPFPRGVHRRFIQSPALRE